MAFQDIVSLGGKTIVPFDMNAGGVVVGWSETAEGPHHAFRWSADSGTQDLGLHGSLSSYANAINDDGIIVGTVEMADQETEVFRWIPGKGMQVVPTGKWICTVEGIDNAGRIFLTSFDDDTFHLLRWSEEPGLEELDSPFDEEVFMTVNAYTKAGVTVGCAMAPGPRSTGNVPFILSLDGKLTILPCPNPSGLIDGEVEGEALGGNSHGQIVGKLAYEEGDSRACVWTPTDTAAAEREPVRVEIQYIILDASGNARRSQTIPHEEIAFDQEDGQPALYFSVKSGFWRKKRLEIKPDPGLAFDPGSARTLKYIVTENPKDESLQTYYYIQPPAAPYVLQELNIPGASWSMARVINDAGFIAGEWRDAGGRESAFLYSPDGIFRDLGIPDGMSCRVAAIDAGNRIAGYMEDEQGNITAFQWIPDGC